MTVKSSGVMEWLGVWNCIFCWALNFEVPDPEIWRKSLLLRYLRGGGGGSCKVLHLISTYFSDSGKWPFHTPPFFNPAKRWPTNVSLCFPPFCQFCRPKTLQTVFPFMLLTLACERGKSVRGRSPRRKYKKTSMFSST